MWSQRGQSTTIFLCIRRFSTWWRRKERTIKQTTLVPCASRLFTSEKAVYCKNDLVKLDPFLNDEDNDNVMITIFGQRRNCQNDKTFRKYWEWRVKMFGQPGDKKTEMEKEENIRRRKIFSQLRRREGKGWKCLEKENIFSGRRGRDFFIWSVPYSQIF